MPLPRNDCDAMVDPRALQVTWIAVHDQVSAVTIVRTTLRWREPDSNHRSRRERDGRRERPHGRPSSSRETTLMTPVYRSGISRRQQPRDLSQERDRWFESGSLQRRVARTPKPGRPLATIKAPRSTACRATAGRRFREWRFFAPPRGDVNWLDDDQSRITRSRRSRRRSAHRSRLLRHVGNAVRAQDHFYPISQERDRWFESGSLQRRVHKPSVPQPLPRSESLWASFPN
jgi:hypothetical protein